MYSLSEISSLLSTSSELHRYFMDILNPKARFVPSEIVISVMSAHAAWFLIPVKIVAVHQEEY